MRSGGRWNLMNLRQLNCSMADSEDHVGERRRWNLHMGLLVDGDTDYSSYGCVK